MGSNRTGFYPIYPFQQRFDREILLNCDATGKSTDDDGRSWYVDVSSQYAPSLSSPSPVASSQDNAPQVPYLTARTFSSPFTYSFLLGDGRKYLRPYFYPSNYTHGGDISDALFSVTAGPSPSSTTSAPTRRPSPSTMATSSRNTPSTSAPPTRRPSPSTMAPSTMNLTFTPSKSPARNPSASVVAGMLLAGRRKGHHHSLSGHLGPLIARSGSLQPGGEILMAGGGGRRSGDGRGRGNTRETLSRYTKGINVKYLYFFSFLPNSGTHERNAFSSLPLNSGTREEFFFYFLFSSLLFSSFPFFSFLFSPNSGTER